MSSDTQLFLRLDTSSHTQFSDIPNAWISLTQNLKNPGFGNFLISPPLVIFLLDTRGVETLGAELLNPVCG